MSGDELVVELGERWIALPAAADPAARRDWPAHASARVRALGAAWPADSAALVPDLLAHALDRRGDEHLVLLYWPVVAPMPATVRIAVLASPGRAAIADDLRAQRAAHAEHVDGARLGPGVEWVHADALPGIDGEQLIGTQACFADDDTLVLVTLDPTLPALLPHVIEEVRELARSVVRLRGGVDWTALPLPEDVAARADLETWADARTGLGPGA